MKRTAIYARVSTDDQTVENQIRELTAVAAEKGWDVVQIFTDEGISGSKGRDKRPGFDDLWARMDGGDFDMVMAWSIDRVGRSVLDLIGFMQAANRKGCDLYFQKQSMDTTSADGRLVFGVMALFAEYEREMIVARVRAGQARAKAAGVIFGPPRQYGKEEVAEVLRLSREDKSLRDIARITGISRSTIARIVGVQTG